MNPVPDALWCQIRLPHTMGQPDLAPKHRRRHRRQAQARREAPKEPLLSTAPNHFVIAQPPPHDHHTLDLPLLSTIGSSTIAPCEGATVVPHEGEPHRHHPSAPHGLFQR
jgi:hypothetical protein